MKLSHWEALLYDRVPVTISGILEKVSEKSGVSIEDIASQRRDKNIVIARQVYCFLAVEKTKETTKSIGKSINRDYSTVIYSRSVVVDMIEVNDCEYISLLEAVGYYKNVDNFEKFLT